MYGSNCKTAESDGVKVLHGCRRAFHDNNQPAFKAIYKVFDNVCFFYYYLSCNLIYLKIKLNIYLNF